VTPADALPVIVGDLMVARSQIHGMRGARALFEEREISGPCAPIDALARATRGIRA